MQRRHFAKQSLALPLLGLPGAPGLHVRAKDVESMQCSSASGLDPWDAVYVNSLVGEPAAALTDHLEEFAADICRRYCIDVILCRAGRAPINVREQLGAKPEVSRGYAAQSERWARFEEGRSQRPRIWLVDSNAHHRIGHYEFAPRLGISSLAGYSLLILDDSRTYIDEAEPVTRIDADSSAVVPRFAISILSALQQRHCVFSAHQRRLNLALATAQTTRAVHPSRAVTQPVEDALQRHSDRNVMLRHSDLLLTTSGWGDNCSMNVWVLSSGPAGRRRRFKHRAADAFAS